ncbi:MAG: hypothetical protein Q8L48_32460 [Archangium sp.]|nr:hypothetical protein [Archangium sp.]
MRSSLLLLVFLSGCAGNVVMVDGIEIYEKVWDRTKGELARRAAAELNCRQVDFTLVRREGRAPVEVLVVGCGRRGMYIKPTATAGGYRVVGSWHLTTVTTDSQGSVPLPPSAPPESI